MLYAHNVNQETMDFMPSTVFNLLKKYIKLTRGNRFYLQRKSCYLI